MNRYESNLKNVSPVIKDLRNEFSRSPRGVHDLSYQADFDASDGWIIPIDYHELVPNSDLYVQYDVSLLSHNPTFRRLLSGASIELRTYKRNKMDSYKGWNNFVTRGRTGKVTKSLPYVDFLLGSTRNDSTFPYAMCTLTPHSPACYLGFVPSVFLGANPWNSSPEFVKSYYIQRSMMYSKSNPEFSPSDFVTGLSGLTTFAQVASSTALRINALPLVFYNAIVKEFQDKNLLINERDGTFSAWQPENEDNDMILPYEATGACISAEFDNWNNPIMDGDDLNVNLSSRPFLNILQRGNKRGDYFDTGSPFPDLLRGDVPTLSVLGGSVDADLDFTDSVMRGTGTKAYQHVGVLSGQMLAGPSYAESGSPIQNYIESSDGESLSLLEALQKGKITNATFNAINFSMNQWRELATMTVFKERMARCDGSYNQMIEAQYSHNPRWHGHEPIFCGGSRQALVFSEVVQQSQSSETPLGTTAGRSVSASQNGQISIHTDDYCDVMTVMIIRPEEFYCQGVDKRVSRLENIEQYFPILNNLAPDATKNKELFVSGNNSIDEDVFNYQERFAFFKSIRNRVSGLLALPASIVGSIGLYVKHRIFSTTPNFNLEFTQENEDSNMKQVYTSSVESEYIIRVATSAKLVAPIPEVTTPSDMGLKY